MSQQYDEYLHEHVSNVNKAMNWLIDHGVIDPYGITGYFALSEGLMNHDESKYQEEEYDAYDDYCYGKEGKDEEDIQVINSAFDYAWLHHIHNNPHHWQYWVLIEDEGKQKALEMPQRYVYEMIADWWSFSWKNGKLTEIVDWYDAHKEKMILHENTRKLVESIIGKIFDIVTEGQDDDNGNDETTA